VLDAAGEHRLLVTTQVARPRHVSDWDREDFIKALDANMLAPNRDDQSAGACDDGPWLGAVLSTLPRNPYVRQLVFWGSRNSAVPVLTAMSAGTRVRSREGCHDQQPACRQFTPPTAPMRWMGGSSNKRASRWKRPHRAAPSQSRRSVTAHVMNSGAACRLSVLNARGLLLWGRTSASTVARQNTDECTAVGLTLRHPWGVAADGLTLFTRVYDRLPRRKSIARQFFCSLPIVATAFVKVPLMSPIVTVCPVFGVVIAAAPFWLHLAWPLFEGFLWREMTAQGGAPGL